MKNPILLISVISLLFANNNMQKDIFLEYTKKIINYKIDINLNKIKTPFYKPQTVFFADSKKIQNHPIKERVKITLLSIFENEAYIKVEKYLGEQQVGVIKKWVNINDKIYGCKLFKLTDTDAVFKCPNKTLYKTINQKMPMLREKR